MPRAIWSGAISFGLVNVPVKLYSAVNRKTVRFNQLEGSTGARVQQKRVSSKTGEEVPFEQIVKGYEISKDRYVVIDPAELEALDPRKTRTIDIQEFVDQDEIDPIFYDHPYYLAPDRGASKPYRLLMEAMRESGKVAIARVVIRSKESLTAIRPLDGVLAMTTMLFADEVLPAERIDEIADAEDEKTTKRELEMAEQLIASLSGGFDPEKYRDEYRDAVMDLIERKAEGKEIAVQEPEEETAEVPDLMAALEASVAAAKGRAKPKSDSNGGAKAKQSSSAKAGASKSGAGASKPKKRAAAKSKS